MQTNVFTDIDILRNHYKEIVNSIIESIDLDSQMSLDEVTALVCDKIESMIYRDEKGRKAFHMCSITTMIEQYTADAYQIHMTEVMQKKWSSKFTSVHENEKIANDLLKLLMEQFEFVDPNAIYSLTHWLRNVKRIAMNLDVKYPTVFGLYGEGGCGKSVLAKQICQALSMKKDVKSGSVTNSLNLLNNWDLLDGDHNFNSSVFLNKVGPLLKEEIGSTSGLRDIIKDFITSDTVKIHPKYRSAFEAKNTYPLILTANEDPSPFLFADEGTEQRRNATWEVLGRRFNHEDWQTGFQYLIENIVKYMSPEKQDDREYTVDLKRSRSCDEQLEILCAIAPELCGEAPFPYVDNNIPERGLGIRDMQKLCESYSAVSRVESISKQQCRSLLITKRFFETRRTNSRNQKYYPIVENIKAAVNDYRTIDKVQKTWHEPTETVNLHRLVDEVIERNSTTPTPPVKRSPLKISYVQNNRSTLAETIELDSFIENLGDPENYPEKPKNGECGECSMLFPGYSSTGSMKREEKCCDSVDVIVLDVDNSIKVGNVKSVDDPNALENFEKEYENYEYYIHETASSTPSWPRFRVILPLDETLNFAPGEYTYLKNSVQERFSRWQDPKVTWFYQPTKGRSVKHHEGNRIKASDFRADMMLQKTVANIKTVTPRKLNNNNNPENKMSHDLVMKTCHEWFSTYYDPNKHHDGKSDGGFYHALQVAIINGDDVALDAFCTKARSEGWSDSQIRHKMRDAEEWARERSNVDFQQGTIC